VLGRVESTFPAPRCTSSKAALTMLTTQYAKAWPDIEVDAADPGCTATDFNGHSGPQTLTELLRRRRRCFHGPAEPVARGPARYAEESCMGSPQSLSEADRRVVAAWAADCAEHVLALFVAGAPDDDRPRALIARTRAFARGELRTADEIRRRFVGGVGVQDVSAPAAAAAARAAGQAVAVSHMGAHALGAAAYAARAAGLADPGRPEAVHEEIRWQLDHMSPEVRDALRALPAAGEDRAGPLGPGLLTSGQLGVIVRELQAHLAGTGPDEHGEEPVPGTGRRTCPGQRPGADAPASGGRPA